MEEKQVSNKQLKDLNLDFQLLFHNMESGFAFNKIVTNDVGKPIDYTFIDVNPAFEKLTGVKKEDILNKQVLDVLPKTEHYWIEKFGEVALTGKSLEYTNYSSEFDRYYETKAYCPKEGYFAVTFTDITEKKKAEIQLSESKEQLKAIIDNTPSALFLLDNEKKIIEQNKQALALNDTKNFINAGLKTGDQIHCVNAINSHNGCGTSVNCGNCSINNLIDSTFDKKAGKAKIKSTHKVLIDGNILEKTFVLSTAYLPASINNAILLILDDVSFQMKIENDLIENQLEIKEKNEEYEAINEELRQTNEELYAAKDIIEKSEEKYRNLFEHSQVPLYRTSIATGKLLECNTKFAELLGYKSIEQVKRINSIALHYANPKDRDIILNELREKSEFHNIILQIITLDNKTKWVKYSGKAYPKQGYLEGGVVDITQLKNTEAELEINQFHLQEKNEEYEAINEELRQTNEELYTSKEIIEESELQIRFLFENMDDAFAYHQIITNKHGEAINYRFLDANQVFLNRMGLEYDQVIGRTALDIFPKTEKNWLEKFGKVATEGTPVIFTEYSEELDKYYQTRAYCPKKGFFAAIFADVTEQKKSEIELKKAKEKAEESDKLKSAFLANMSHEIRTPLNGITGFTSLLNLQLTEKKFNMYTDIIDRSSDQLIGIINNILDLSKIESGLETINKQEFCVNDEIDSLLAKYSILINPQNIEFKKTTNGARVIFNNDRTKFTQIFNNLLNNALKFTSKGKIVFGYQHIDDNIIFFVSDTGIGIREEDQAFIFDHFRQVDNTNSRNYGGNGIGLSLVKSYVKLMGGEIWLESEPEQGTIFKFTLNGYLRPKETPSFKIEKQQEETDWCGKHILIVEDDIISQQLLCEILSPKSPILLTANDGLEALKLIKEYPTIDLILLDIKMPNLDGYGTIKEIKKINSKIPIIAQTAHAFTEDKNKIQTAGFDEFISKPVKTETLFKLINKHFR